MIAVKPCYFYKDTAFSVILFFPIKLILKPNLLELFLIVRRHCIYSE